MGRVMKTFVLLALLNLATASPITPPAPTKELNDGNKIPTIALGTSGSERDKTLMRQTINWAVEAGYRHIDTASFYENEEEIGQGIRDVIGKGLVKREDLFVTTKLWNDKHDREEVVPALRESLKRLKLDYVDLYLIHFPMAMTKDGRPLETDYLDTWRGMEEAKKLGLAKSIGVSNFNSKQVDRLIEKGEVKPAVVQVEVNPTFTNEKLTEHLQKKGIVMMAYSPQGFLVSRGDRDAPPPPPKIDDPELMKIANKYGKTTSQVVLRYLVERGLIPIPKSTNKERLQQNIDLFNFKLTEDEVATINKFNKNIKLINIEDWKTYPNYPFDVEY